MKRIKLLLLALVLAVGGVTQAQQTFVLLAEDFEGLPLGPNVDEGLAGEAVWTNIPPAGWINDASEVPGFGDPANDGVTEWAGWGFADKNWWAQTAGDQRRTEFTLGQGTVAIADPDEWDDAGHPGVPATGTYNVWLSTAPIDLSSARAGTVKLQFDSSWRPEYDDNYHQTANITVSFDGGQKIEILRWESDSSSPNFHPDTSTNETIVLDIPNPAGATSMVITFGLFDAGNDWWWAIDNILVTGVWSGVRASNPDPENGEVEVSVKKALSWTPGQYVGVSSPKHRVSLSDDVAAVDSGAAVVSTQDPNSFDATGHLDFSTTYYWRVDEANGVGWDVGNVWHFTTESFAYTLENVVATSNGASDASAGPENTVNGSGLNDDDQHSTRTDCMWLATAPAGEDLYIQYEFDGVYKLHEMLVWNYNAEFELILGFGLKDVTVAYSQNGTDWIALGDVEFAKATAKGTYAANTTVNFGGVAARYVRLTVNSGWGTMGQYGLSEVRFMFIPAQARQPQPADGATGVPIDTVLSWRSGREAVSHKVYLGTAADAPTLVGTVSAAAFAPSNLEFGSTYYWRVEEVNEADEVPVWASALWSFTTAEFAVVDDFESYNDDMDAKTTIFDTWIDGWINNTGSTVGYLTAPFAERAIVHGGRQSMPLSYDNGSAPFYSEAERTFDDTQDWTAGGGDSLRLYFRGKATNSPQTLYITLEDRAGHTATVSNADPDAVLVETWQLWQVALSEFSGVNPASIEKMTIGVGNRTSPTAGGTGTVYIDDIGFGRPAVAR
ncbi:MAG TPA: discoidin domain-containing protein [Sedimentisphaerales bacterium]|nr:discoidin domain-containing protein [Sedimentisphaerales bacterium]HRS12083.1 discoidin domain-containing protein [Sedimentisphaerales bacterium]HRV48681.1 discoidin domain-containing protein [Sedimentisphaerales bacterium]